MMARPWSSLHKELVLIGICPLSASLQETPGMLCGFMIMGDDDDDDNVDDDNDYDDDNVDNDDDDDDDDDGE